MKDYRAEILRITGASTIVHEQIIQSLWGGYGQLLRVKLDGGERPSVIVKHIAPPNQSNHPRGWNTNRSHERKLRSYEVEWTWYQHYNKVDSNWRIPEFIGASAGEGRVLLILEDLDSAGFSLRKQTVNLQEIKTCLDWLAHFHAEHLGVSPKGLWEIGTYWHLDTRPDEWDAMPSGKLKEVATQLDAKLNGAQFLTLVHGDAKLANFCFAEDGSTAAVDFQYVGQGCGMKDVAYFISSCLSEEECELFADELLTSYFLTLQRAVRNQDLDFAVLEAEWRELYAFAWADFARFLIGWYPEHYKLHGYTHQMVQKALKSLA